MHVSIPLSTPVDRVHFHPSISHCIFMCIVGSENMLLFKLLGWYHLSGLNLKPTQCSYTGAFIKVIILQRKYDQNYFLPLSSEPSFNPRPLNEILIPFKGSLLRISTSLSLGVSPPPQAPGEIHTLYTFQCNTTESETHYDQRHL